MPDLPSVTADEAIAVFEEVGFQLDRIRGSHHILKKPGHLYALSVPNHGNQPLRAGTLRRLIRDAGITVEEFIRCL